MSWSVTFIGKVENVVAALEEQSKKMEGQSKVEFDSVLPHLVGIAKENFGMDNPLLKVTASGHGYAADGKQVNRQCVVNVERVYGMLV